MNERVLRITEYSRILERLEAHATSEPGRRLCRELTPYSDLAEIEDAQTETADALARLFRKGRVSFGSARNFTDCFRALAIESSLTAAELLHLASFLENVRVVRDYGVDDKEDSPRDSLSDLFECLVPLPSLVTGIRRAILSEEEIADDASSELRRIRRGIAQSEERIHAVLSKMVNGSYASYLQDNVITMRGDRYVIPVRAEFKGQVSGIVHDQSSSGSTLFIEPSAVVELNNEIRTLEIEEQKEIARILADLSAEAAEHLTALKDNAANMIRLDFIFARAGLAMDMNAVRPLMNEEHNIDLKKARHPLLDPKTVVPIDIALGREYNMVVITGPNTGGKTVTLKTVGLLTLMGMSGLHIPAADRSELSVFREVFADIGDEQSIEQNLSTFSAHMTTIVDVLRRCDKNCLCLFDELGAGTDPTEGAALAISILNFMHTRGIRTLATTHYSELKVYAMKTEGVVNASAEFDVETLRPTYRLLMGVAGKSNAFAISQKLGLPGYIIETARAQLSEETQNFESLLTDLETDRKRAEREREEAEAGRAEIERRLKALEAKERDLEEKKTRILAKAEEEAGEILSAAKAEADEAISALRKAGNDAALSDMERQRTALTEKVKSHKDKTRKGPAKPEGKKVRPDKLMLGDRVKVVSMGLTGTVSTLPDKKGKLYVQCGILRSQVDVSDLILIEEDAMGNPVAQPKKGSALKRAFAGGGGSGEMDLSRASTMSSEINLLGMTTDEAIHALDKYLDDARLSHLHSVRVVHGKGTGALRQAIQQYLRRQKWIKGFRSGEFGEGDAGVTIVMLTEK